MGNQPPTEAQRMINEFKAQQAAEEEARTKAKKVKFEKGKPQVEKRQWTYAEMEEMARNMGFGVESGGEHKHIVDSRGKIIAPLPGQGGDNLATGTAKAILRALRRRAGS